MLISQSGLKEEDKEEGVTLNSKVRGRVTEFLNYYLLFGSLLSWSRRRVASRNANRLDDLDEDELMLPYSISRPSSPA